jgi:hypothetical protein
MSGFIARLQGSVEIDAGNSIHTDGAKWLADVR